MLNWITRAVLIHPVSIRLGQTSLRTFGLALALMASLAISATVSAQESSAVYDANCSLCHQRAGAGVKGQFPRLAGRAREIAATAAGRRLLIEITLFGMAGKVGVDGADIIGVMPGLPALSDADVAAALNYLLSLEGPAPSTKKKIPPAVTVQEIAEVRAGAQLSPTQVHAKRQALLQSKKK